MSAAAAAELDLFRRTVNCAAVLERMGDGWKLDARESTKRALKYRRGAGEIIIVNHDGRGWWDATGSAKGDVFDLVQHLDPSLNFGQVRQVLRGFIGARHPAIPPRRTAERSPAERWAARPRAGDAAWTYLAGARAIPDPFWPRRRGRTACATALTAAPGSRTAGRAKVTQVEIREPDLQRLAPGRTESPVPLRDRRSRLRHGWRCSRRRSTR